MTKTSRNTSLLHQGTPLSLSFSQPWTCTSKHPFLNTINQAHPRQRRSLGLSHTLWANIYTNWEKIYTGFCDPFLPMRDLWICGITPPPAMVALMSESNSSSPRIANCRWRGVIRFTLRSLEALPANSSTCRSKRSTWFGCTNKAKMFLTLPQLCSDTR